MGRLMLKRQPKTQREPAREEALSLTFTCDSCRKLRVEARERSDDWCQGCTVKFQKAYAEFSERYEALGRAHEKDV